VFAVNIIIKDMKTKPLTFLLALTFLFLFSGSVYGDDFQDGYDAYLKQDYKKAVRLYRLSAEQGNALAQYSLGLMHQKGQGVPIDYVLAHMWVNLSASKGIEIAIKGRDFLEKQMSPSQIEKAQELVRNWKPSNRIKTAESPSTIIPQPSKSNGEEPEVERRERSGDEQRKVLRTYWDNGNLKLESHYIGKKSKPKFDGRSTMWYESGNKKSENHYKNGIPEGWWTDWHESGEKSLEAYYKNGKSEGTRISWNASGKKKWVQYYKNGIKVGTWTDYWHTGEKHYEMPYKNGKEHGLKIEWYPSGEKLAETPYKNGKREGIQTRWYKSRIKLAEIPYKNGKREGVRKRWYKSGAKKSLKTYKNGVENGLRKEWDENGKLTVQGYFVDRNEEIK